VVGGLGSGAADHDHQRGSGVYAQRVAAVMVTIEHAVAKGDGVASGIA
jgi:hypothetical protein